MPETPAAIEARGISKRFPGVLALDDVSVAIRAGEVHALVGQNGAGKSTLIKILAGASLPDSGTVSVRGRVVRFSGPLHAIHEGIATIAQEMSLIPTLSVAENIFIGRLPLRSGKRVDWRLARRRAAEALGALGFDFDPVSEVSRLSVAHQQAVEIARALSRQADVLIMDEPTSALAAREVERLLETIERLRSRGRAIIYVSHRFDEVFRIADRISVFREGRLVTTADTAAMTQDEVVRLMVGREISAPTVRLKPVSYDTAPVLEVAGLTGSAFSDISIRLHPGEVLGLSGLVGSGRTDVVRAIFGADPIASGRVLVDGKQVDRIRPDQMIALGVALAPEDRKRHGLSLSMSVLDNLSLVALARRAMASIRRFVTEQVRARDHIASLSIRTPKLSTPVINLSGGNQQKVVIGKWLEVKPRILIFDEPTRGIDIAAKADIFRIMKDLADEGMGIIVISSEQAEILLVSDRILVMREGRITAELVRSQASEETLTQAAFGRLPPPSGNMVH